MPTVVRCRLLVGIGSKGKRKTIRFIGTFANSVVLGQVPYQEAGFAFPVKTSPIIFGRLVIAMNSKMIGMGKICFFKMMNGGGRKQRKLLPASKLMRLATGTAQE